MNKPANIVLLIEDESKIRRFLRAGFELRGFSVLEAENADEGLKAATFNTPEVSADQIQPVVLATLKAAFAQIENTAGMIRKLEEQRSAVAA